MASAATGQARVALASSAVAEGSARGALPKPANFQRFGVLQRKCGCEGPGSTFGECAECKAERGAPLQRASTQLGTQRREPDEVPPIVHEVLRSPGHPLDAATRAFMEPRFGHDFSAVRVHADAKAAESARAVNALAYTVGRNVVFGREKYAARTIEGKKLLAHELTHVVQQRGVENGAPRIGPSGGTEEFEAARVSERILSDGVQLISSTVSNPRVQRQTGPTRSHRRLDGCDIHFIEKTAQFLDSTESKECFDLLCVFLKSGHIYKATLYGFASGEGDKAFSSDLSQKRADAVKQRLIESGILDQQITAIGQGADNSYAVPADGRRVVVSVNQVAVVAPKEVPSKAAPTKTVEPKLDIPTKEASKPGGKAPSSKKGKNLASNESPPACDPVLLDVSFQWKDYEAIPLNLNSMVDEMKNDAGQWKPCNKTIEIVINSPWKGDIHAPHANWHWLSPLTVMKLRADLIRKALISGGVPANAFLRPTINFKQPDLQNAQIHMK